MVLKIIENDIVYVFKDIDKTFCRTRSSGGMMYLQFDISLTHPLYSHIQEETRLEYDNQIYVVKGINERTKAKICTINAELDLTGLDCKVFGQETLSTRPFRSLCSHILPDTGWTVVDASLISKRTTTDLTDKTPRKILEQCMNLTSYRACYRFETKSKEIYCIKPYNNTTPKGTYFTDELNLSEVTFKGSSASLITRLIPIGKDGLTIESVNDGKNYIDNFTYTKDIIADTWRDERYTDAQSLYDDAVVKLAELAVPERSYTCKVIDLAKIKPEIYGNHLAFDLYDIVTLVDRNRKTRIDHRIVEIREYPFDHTLDTVTLSSVAGRVTGKLSTLENRLAELNAQTLHDRTKVNEIKQDLDTTVLHVSESWASSVEESWFEQTSQGLFLETSKMLGSSKWSTLLQQSYQDIMIAWNSSSDYIKFELDNAVAKMNFYSSPKTNSNNPNPILSIDKSGEKIYDSSGSLLMQFSTAGMEFYHKNNYVGKIGTSGFIGAASYRGLTFNLNNSAATMAWAREDTENSGVYNLKWAYIKPNITYGSFSGGNEKNGDGTYAGSLHANCSINLHNWYLHNAKLKDWNFEGGSFTGSKTFCIPTSIRTDGTVALWRTVTLNFKNGVLQSADGW